MASCRAIFCITPYVALQASDSAYTVTSLACIGYDMKTALCRSIWPLCVDRIAGYSLSRRGVLCTDIDSIESQVRSWGDCGPCGDMCGLYGDVYGPCREAVVVVVVVVGSVILPSRRAGSLRARLWAAQVSLGYQVAIILYMVSIQIF